MYNLKDVMHESKYHWVLRVTGGYEVYRIGITHSTRCAQIGFTDNMGLLKAITECTRRDNIIDNA